VPQDPAAYRLPRAQDGGTRCWRVDNELRPRPFLWGGSQERAQSHQGEPQKPHLRYEPEVKMLRAR
jgi:hypothetical protein